MDATIQLCSTCRLLTLERISNTANCKLRWKHEYPEKEQDVLDLAHGLKVPIQLSLENILSSHPECRICELLYQQLDTKLYADHENLEAYVSKAPDGKLRNLWMYVPGDSMETVTIDLSGVEGSPNAEQFFYRTITSPGSEDSLSSPNAEQFFYRTITSPGSEDSLSRIRGWIEDCTASHPRCQLDLSGSPVQKFSKLPTRVISVGDHGGDVSLFVSGGQSANYIALSHCWGGASLIRTTTALLDEFEQSIKYKDLSKTIQDAIHVTRELGIQYLWVDSLCIVQDDEEDWSNESKKMASVYEEAYLTIAATAAKDGTGGLFLPRPRRNLVEIPCDPMDPNSGYLSLEFRDKNEMVSIFEGPLNSRAWVHQERLFSRRTIHFAFEQLYWECDKHFIAEDNYDTNTLLVENRFVPTRSMLRYSLQDQLGKTRNPLLRDVVAKENPAWTTVDFHGHWAQHIVFFSRCGLTKASDKLPALYSLAKKLEGLTKCAYHEGHWFDGSNFTLTGLLWHAAKGETLKNVNPSRAPSWSWASLEGSLEYLDFSSWQNDVWHPQRWDMRILCTEIFKPLGREPVKALMIKSVKIPCSRYQCPDSPVVRGESSDACTGLMFTSVVSGRGELIKGSLEFDLEEDQPPYFWLIPVHARCIEQDSSVWFVLLASEELNQNKKGVIFRRIGCGWLDHPSWLCERDRDFMVII